MRQIALYGKGGIGKSTVASHLSYTIAERGLKVLQVGCSPKNDSTNQLLTTFPPTILDVLREKEYEYDELTLGEIITESPLRFDQGGKIYCAESGGPEPGVDTGADRDHRCDREHRGPVLAQVAPRPHQPQGASPCHHVTSSRPSRHPPITTGGPRSPPDRRPVDRRRRSGRSRAR